MAISVVLYIGISRLLKVAEVTSLLKVIRPER
jgi:hypothetical protein